VDYRGRQEELRALARAQRAAFEEPWSAFARFHRAAMDTGQLDRKIKELIALAIAVVKRCEGCIIAHARGAALAKATEREVAEALAVALMMDGAPATVYGPMAFDAFKSFVATGDGSTVSATDG
jgi:AhpD family alkylhydroperoxidase